MKNSLILLTLAISLATGPRAAADSDKERNIRVASMLSALAKAMYDSGNYEKAIEPLQKALALRESAQGPNDPDVAATQHNLAELYRHLGRFKEAEALYLRALATSEKVSGPKSTEVATNLVNLGELYRDLGQFQKAESFYERGLAMRRELLGPSHPDVFEALHNMALLYAEMGDLDKAEGMLRQALPGTLDPRARSAVLANLAELQLRRAEKTKGRDRNVALDKATTLQQDLTQLKAWPESATLLNNQASLALAQGDGKKAEELLLHAMKVAEQKEGPDSIGLAIILNTLGSLYLGRAQFKEAKESFQRTIKIMESKWGASNPRLALALHNLGTVYIWEGEIKRQKESVELSGMMAQAVQTGADAAALSKMMGQLIARRRSQGEAASSGPLFQRAVDILEDSLQQMVTEPSMVTFLDKIRDMDDVYYGRLADFPLDPSLQKLGLTAALLHKGRSAEAGAQTARTILASLRRPEERAQFMRWKTLLSQLSNLYLSPSSSKENIAALKKEADSLLHTLAQESSALRTLLLPTEPAEVIERVAAALPQDAALVEIVVYKPFTFILDAPPSYLAIILQPDRSIAVSDLGPVSRIDAAVRSFLDGVSNPKNAYQKAATDLYTLVLKPIQQRVPGRNRLFLSPDGQLSLVPFEALYDGKHFAIETQEFTYLTSGRDLLRQPEPGRQSGPTLVLADPDYQAQLVVPNGATHSASPVSPSEIAALLAKLPRLPRTRTEAESIAKVVVPTKLLFGVDATESALLGANSPRILHIATHGIFFADNSPASDAPDQRSVKRVPILSDISSPPPASVMQDLPLARGILVMAGAERLAGQPIERPDGQRLDGLATALEVTGMDLWGTQLVVLSACDTGKGELGKIGQGVYGLRRAFFLAGAETLVTSLWQVSDRATRDLMASYYQNLVKGQGRVAAMHAAALAIRRDYPHPHFWAPFIVLGQSGPLRQ